MSAEDLKVAVCQSDIVWEDAASTIARIEAPVAGFCKRFSPDILVLPETFSVGFSMNPEVSEQPDGISASWLRRMARETGAAFIASVPTYAEDGLRRNRCYFITPSGEEFTYDKRHLFNPSGEGRTYVPGTGRTTVSYKGWNIELNVCYDLRFPVWSRGSDNRYDLLVNIANWPDVRIEAAKTLIKARAIENCAYALFCNRIGSDPLCNYNGQSAVVDYFGGIISKVENFEGVDFHCAELSAEGLAHYRQKFPAWKDADQFAIL